MAGDDGSILCGYNKGSPWMEHRCLLLEVYFKIQNEADT